MVYNEKMDKILNENVSKWENLSKKKMFGGTGYLINGKMVAGVYKDYYIFRIGEKNAKLAIKSPKIKLMDITSKPMKGWIMAEESAFSEDAFIIKLNQAKNFVDTLASK